MPHEELAPSVQLEGDDGGGHALSADEAEKAAAKALALSVVSNVNYDQDFVTTLTAVRYLRANSGDAAKARAQLEASLAWRAEKRPWEACKRCVKDPFAHSHRLVGVDPLGRTIQYSCCGTAYDRWDPEDNLQHLTWVMEQSARLMDARGQHHQWVIIADFLGFGMYDADPRTAVLVARALAHYPERLACMVLLDSPVLFRGTWRAVRPLLNEVTKSKIRFVSRANFGALAAELGLGEEVTGWLTSEMDDNRCTAASKGKSKSKYWEKTDTGFDKRATSSLLAAKDFTFQLDGLVLPAAVPTTAAAAAAAEEEDGDK